MIFPAALIFCIVGVYLSTGGMFGVAIMLLAALVSHVMRATGYPVIVFIIAFFLGENFERSLSQTLVILDGDLLALAAHPIAGLLFLLSIASVAWFLLPRRVI